MKLLATQTRLTALDTILFSWEPRRQTGNGDVFLFNICNRLAAEGFASVAKALRLMSNIVFETFIDDSLAKITSLSQLKSLLNKRVLSLANDFEDGKWRYNRLKDFLWDNIAQTALSERERLALADGSHSTLAAAARNLRLTDKDTVGQGSEIAEVFLYGVMRKHYKALPVVPKIFYKQNVQDNAKGADSVHIVVDEAASDFTLWFGEAKFYNSIADARLDAVVTSVYASLDTGKLRKENSIITNVSDLDQLSISASLRERIKAALSSQVSIDHLKSKIHVPILIMHQCNETASCPDLSPAYKKAIIDHHTERAESYFTKQLANSATVHKYDDISFHMILFPVPNKKLIVDAFLTSASYFKNAG